MVCETKEGDGRMKMMSIFTLEESTDAVEGEADANNNGTNKSEKYSLRPRSLRQKTEKGLELKKGILTQRCKKKDDKNKPKQKPPPLSKYRRKTANARERNRMREINVAFETLRRAVPHIASPVTAGNEKLTKITTLRLAMKYIQALRQVLESGQREQTMANLLCDETDFEILLSDGESLQFQSDMSESFASPDHPLTSPFSEPSDQNYGSSSPGFTGSHNHFQFSDLGSEFGLSESLPGSDFCEDFLSPHCDGLS